MKFTDTIKKGADKLANALLGGDVIENSTTIVNQKSPLPNKVESIKVENQSLPQENKLGIPTESVSFLPDARGDETSGLMDFDLMAYVLGVREKDLPVYKQKYLNELSDWFDLSYILFISRERELLNTLSAIRESTVDENFDKNLDLPTLAKSYLSVVAIFRNNIDNFNEIANFRTKMAKFTKLSTLCDNLGIYSKHMDDYKGLLLAFASLNWYHASKLKEQKLKAEKELEAIKYYAVENKELKEKQAKILTVLASLKLKYSENLEELNKLESGYVGEKHELPKHSDIPKINKPEFKYP